MPIVIITGAIIASDLSSSGWRSVAGLIIAAVGFAVYILWRSSRVPVNSQGGRP